MRKMGPFLLLVLLSWGCFKPSKVDFSREKGLQDDEFIWVVQWDRTVSEEARLINAVEPILRTGLRDDVPLYLRYGNDQAMEAEEIAERKSELGIGGAGNGLTEVVQLYVRGKTNEGDGGETVFVQYMYVDSNRLEPAQIFGGVYLDQLAELKPKFAAAQEQRMEQLKKPYLLGGLVTYLRTNELEFIPSSDRESNLLREKIGQGKWRELEWVDGKLNGSGRRPIELETDMILGLSGNYLFGDSTYQDLFLTAEVGCLVADWSHRFAVEKLYPFQENGFFSLNGETYLFDSDSVYFIQAGDSLVGHRINAGATAVSLR